MELDSFSSFFCSSSICVEVVVILEVVWKMNWKFLDLFNCISLKTTKGNGV